MERFVLRMKAVAVSGSYNDLCDRICQALEGIVDSVGIEVIEAGPERDCSSIVCPSCGRPGVCPEVQRGGQCSLPQEISIPHSRTEEGFLESADDEE